MKKRNPLIYFLFGIYPISLFDLGNSKTGLLKQLLIIFFITSALLIAANLFKILNIISFIAILFFAITPYFIGKLFRYGLID